VLAAWPGTPQLGIALRALNYDPFGNQIGPAPSSWLGTRGFVGGTADPATGLTNLGAREYNPATGSFISPDPLLSPDQPQDLNAYAYALDDPASQSDPSGKMVPGQSYRVNPGPGPTTAPGAGTANQPASQPGYTAQAADSCGIMCSHLVQELGLLDPVTTPVRARAVRQVSAGITGSQGIIDRLTKMGTMQGGVAIPLGFSSLAQYLRFAGNLNQGLSNANYGRAQVYFRGSSVTNVSYKNGTPFDGGPKGRSDYDIAISGDDIFEAARDAGIPLRGGGTRTGPLNESQEDSLGLADTLREARQMAGRDVSVMIYSDEAAVAQRPGAYITVPDSSEIQALDPQIAEAENLAGDEGLVDLIFDSGDDGE
jgi:RHS repeat-associated protein